MLDKCLKLIDRLCTRHIVMVFTVTCITVFTNQNIQAQNNQSQGPTLLIMGDSLSAEYGITKGSGWVELLNKRLKKEQKNIKIINASISGETTSGGLIRLNNLLKNYQPQIVIIELGANDGLRGLQIQAAEKNLKQMIIESQKYGAKVLLLGMKIPPNYGQDYTQRFSNMYGKLARSEGTALVPFFLDKVADKVELFQADHIHPNEKAQSILLENVWTELNKILPQFN